MQANKSHILPIIILNWNGFDDTKECVQSVLKQNIDNIQIYLVDNNSDSKEKQLLKNEFGSNTKIKLIFNEKNLGFTRAHNHIFKEIIAENYKYILLLNNDTVLAENSLRYFMEYIDSENHGMVGCKLIKYHDKNQLDSIGHKILSNGEIIPLAHNKAPQKFNTTFEPIGASAAAVLYAVSMLKDIGIFDEYFETGYEDAELGLRAFIAGYRCKYDPRIIVYHKIGRSVSKVFDLTYIIKIQLNICYTYLKLVHWPVILINFIPWLIRHIVIFLIAVLMLRKALVKVQIHVFLGLFRERKILRTARKNAKQLRRISWLKLCFKHELFLKDDIRKFYTFVLKRKKSHLENY